VAHHEPRRADAPVLPHPQHRRRWHRHRIDLTTRSRRVPERHGGYKWLDASNNSQVVYGNAYISSGSYAASAIGWNGFDEERNIPAAHAQGDPAASFVLSSMSRRGHAYSMSAISAYWL
jgi:hypothetical protein